MISPGFVLLTMLRAMTTSTLGFPFASRGSGLLLVSVKNFETPSFGGGGGRVQGWDMYCGKAVSRIVPPRDNASPALLPSAFREHPVPTFPRSAPNIDWHSNGPLPISVPEMIGSQDGSIFNESTRPTPWP